MEGGDGGGDGDGVGGVDWGQLHADFLELVLERAGWQEAVAASAVCWHWRATSKQDNLWRKYCERDYPDYAERHRQDPGWLTDWRTVFIAAHSSPGDNVQQHRKHHPTESCTLLPRSDADKRVLDVCFCGADCVVSACWGGGGELELHVWNLLDDSCSSIACGRLREDVGRSKPIVRLYWNGELLLVAVLSCSEVNHVEVWDIQRAARLQIYETPSSIVLAVHGDTVLLFHQVHHKLGLWRMDLNEYKELAVDVGDFLPLSVHLDSRGHPVPSGMINAAVVEVATACNDDTNHNIISVLSTTTQECFLEVKDLICLEHELNQLALLPMALAVIVTSLRTVQLPYTHSQIRSQFQLWSRSTSLSGENNATCITKLDVTCCKRVDCRVSGHMVSYVLSDQMQMWKDGEWVSVHTWLLCNGATGKVRCLNCTQDGVVVCSPHPLYGAEWDIARCRSAVYANRVCMQLPNSSCLVVVDVE